MDLSHIDTSTKVFSCDSISKEAENSDIVVIAAGRARKQGMTRDDLFKMNASIIKEILDELLKIKHTPKIAIITNPINSIVPFAYRYYSKMCSHQSPDFYNRTRIFGITTLDCVRSSTFYANYLGKDPRDVIVPVVGGHSDTTMVPLFSMSNFPLEDASVALRLTKEVREAGTRVVDAKKGAVPNGSATLSMAYAANRFINSV
ncbi:hypothetical protein MXB_459 [Myxobolus squamalis]|nr:hypothetical protein MXB_459 [Myxobolus squamalis]